MFPKTDMEKGIIKRKTVHFKTWKFISMLANTLKYFNTVCIYVQMAIVQFEYVS